MSKFGDKMLGVINACIALKVKTLKSPRLLILNFLSWIFVNVIFTVNI